VHTRSPEKIREQFKRLGLDTDTLECNDKLRVFDWYTATLGMKPKEKRAVPSLKIADLSLDIRDEMRQTPEPEVLQYG